MKQNIVWLLLFCVVILLTACSKEQPVIEPTIEMKEAKPPLIQAIRDKDITKVKEIATSDKESLNQMYSGSTPLHLAIFSADGEMEIIKILVENGADYALKDDSGTSAFFLSVDLCFVKAIDYFLDNGKVNVNELDNEGNTPLMMLALRGGIPTDVFMGITERMVKAGADLSIKNNKGDTFYSNVKKVQYDKTIKEIEGRFPSILK